MTGSHVHNSYKKVKYYVLHTKMTVKESSATIFEAIMMLEEGRRQKDSVLISTSSSTNKHVH